MTKAILSRTIVILSVLLICSILYAGCDRPYMIPVEEWNTSADECANCHSKDLIFAKPQTHGHSDIHCLECHVVNPSHLERRDLGFDGTYENVPINEARCLLCHPADRYSNPGHWQHLGVRATHNGKPMQCIDCHTKGHSLASVVDCSVCHEETETNSQMMASGHCTICHGFKGTTLLGKKKRNHPYDSAKCGVCHTLEDKSAELDPDSFRAALDDPHIAKSSCGTCHTPHRSEDPSVELTCKNCHKAKELKKEAAHNIPGHQSFDCQTCHVPHNFANVSDSSCELCHGEDVSGVMKSGSDLHKDCNSCHEKSDFSKIIPNSCNSCHSSQNKALVSGPKAHGGCDTCHVAHEWEKSANGKCAMCHSVLAAESKAVAAKRDCAMCHDSHSASSITMPSGCANCHSDETKACSQSDIKKDCSLCHTPHTWQADWVGCTSCHDSMESGLHKEHLDFGCSACHVGHNWSPTQRSACLECHSDKDKDHFESEMLCTECHW